MLLSDIYQTSGQIGQCYISDNDPNWELDTPEKFSDEVLAFLLSRSDDMEEEEKEYEDYDVVVSILNRYDSLANFFITFEDYIVEYSSHGDFG